MICQFCRASNPDGGETCVRCGNKLLVVSGPPDSSIDTSEEAYFQAQEELEEHLLERISTLEDSVRQLSQAVAATAEHLEQIEHNLTVTHAGVQALSALLDAQGVVSRTEVVEGWERTVGQELLSRDLARRFSERANRILSQAVHGGHATPEFRRRLRALELALVALESGAAQELLAELVRMAPTNDELWSFIGETAFETGDLESAKIAFTRVLDLRGPHFETLIYLGTVASDLGEWELAEASLRQARDMDPEAFLPRFTLGALGVLRGSYAAALKEIETALERQEAPQALYIAGVCELNLGHHGRAVAALRRAVELAPDFEDALYQLGIAYLRRGWSRLALDTFQQVLRLDPQCLQYQETVRLLSLHPPQNLPSKIARMVSQAEQALEHGHPKAAMDLFAAAATAQPSQPDLQASAALLASALGRTRDAVHFAHRLLRQEPPGPPYQAAAVVALLESLRQAGRPKAARTLARRLHRDAKDQLTRGLAAYELALVESELGEDLRSARDLAREALDTTPKELRHYPLAALGMIALRRGRFREAIGYLEQATEAGHAPLLLRQLAVARLGAGDTEGAEAALQEAQDESSGGINEEMLGHVRRLGSLLDDLTARQHPASAPAERHEALPAED